MIYRFIFAALAILGSVPASAAEKEAPQWAELVFVSEHAVDGMASGNLSGMAWCGSTLWAVSDRDDGRLYRLQAAAEEKVWPAEPEAFTAPPPPANGLPWGMRSRALLSAIVRGGKLDFEGITCDSLGNRYLVSEAFAAVLMLPVTGEPYWLNLPQNVIRHSRAAGMLMRFNALFEGVTVDPGGKRLWLAAERERRGLVALRQTANGWRCEGNCVLMMESGLLPPPQSPLANPLQIDFSDVVFYHDKLFTLERLSQQICRRDLQQGQVEKCWSFSQTLQAPEHTYGLPYGLAEALVIDDNGAWVGLDNGGYKRLLDADDRPYVLRFAAPKGGWLTKK